MEKGNQIIIDLALYYVQTMVGNLSPFNKLKEKIINIVNEDSNRKDKTCKVNSRLYNFII